MPNLKTPQPNLKHLFDLPNLEMINYGLFSLQTLLLPQVS